jgi:hypothetical protein
MSWRMSSNVLALTHMPSWAYAGPVSCSHSLHIQGCSDHVLTGMSLASSRQGLCHSVTYIERWLLCSYTTWTKGQTTSNLLAIPHLLQCTDSLQCVARLGQDVFHIRLGLVTKQGRPFSIDKSSIIPRYLRGFLACLIVLHPAECSCNTWHVTLSN